MVRKTIGKRQRRLAEGRELCEPVCDVCHMIVELGGKGFRI